MRLPYARVALVFETNTSAQHIMGLCININECATNFMEEYRDTLRAMHPELTDTQCNNADIRSRILYYHRADLATTMFMQDNPAMYLRERPAEFNSIEGPAQLEGYILASHPRDKYLGYRPFRDNKNAAMTRMAMMVTKRMIQVHPYFFTATTGITSNDMRLLITEQMRTMPKRPYKNGDGYEYGKAVVPTIKDDIVTALASLGNVHYEIHRLRLLQL